MNLGPKKRPQATRHCGFVVSELDGVGAGSEGWINDPSLLLAMSRHLLALAKGRTTVIVGWEGEASEAPMPVSISLPKGEEDHEIKAMQWLDFQRWAALALGTTQGSVLFYSSKGTLLLRQIFQSTPVLQLRVRGFQKSSQNNSAEELCVVYSKAVVRVDSSDLQPLLHRCLRDAEERARKGSSDVGEDSYFNSHRLAYQVWNVSRNIGVASTCVDGVITGVMAPPLLEHQSKQRYFCAITVGPNCALAAHRLSEDRNSSITNLIMKRIMPATVSTISALTKILWRNSDQQQASDFRPPEVKPQDYGRASLITSLKDHPRKGERIALSPSGSMAAVTDSLGRILLIDTLALVVIRLWKGYRDAHCFFIEVPIDHNAASTSRRPPRENKGKHDYVLCLAIHAPRRGVIEIWKLRDGARVSVVKCGSGCRVIEPASLFHGLENDSLSEYIPAEVFILNGDSGHLAIVSPQISHFDDYS